MSILPTTYVEGERARISAEFREGKTLVDPAVIVFKYQKPGASVVSLQYGVNAEVVRDSEGKYHIDFDTTGAVGVTPYRVYTVGSFQGAQQGKLRVKAANPA